MKLTERYSTPAVMIHWITAALVLAALPLGLYMSDLTLSPFKLKLISYHKWIGVTVLLLVVPRVALRLTRPRPAPQEGPAWQRKAAAATHRLLYCLLLLIPLTGWLMSSAKGFPVVYLGLVPLPDLVGKDAAIGDLLRNVHASLNYLLMLLLTLHIGAALKHHLLDRDNTLVRMLPILKRAT